MDRYIQDNNEIVNISILLSERSRLKNKSGICNAEVLSIFDQLCQFEFGRFLIKNKKIDAFWTNELVTWTKDNNRELHPLEKLMFTKLPLTLATRERYHIFCEKIKKNLPKNGWVASIPCGLMRDVLNFSNMTDARFLGIDLDGDALSQAKYLATHLGVLEKTILIKGDAWDMTYIDTFDMITSNGLNIYEPSDKKIVELYSLFYKALKDGGVLIISFLKPPSLDINHKSEQCNFNLDKEALRVQNIIFENIIGSHWVVTRTEENTINQLQLAGFKSFDIIYDQMGLFPTVIAKK